MELLLMVVCFRPFMSMVSVMVLLLLLLLLCRAVLCCAVPCRAVVVAVNVAVVVVFRSSEQDKRPLDGSSGASTEYVRESPDHCHAVMLPSSLSCSFWFNFPHSHRNGRVVPTPPCLDGSVMPLRIIWYYRPSNLEDELQL